MYLLQTPFRTNFLVNFDSISISAAAGRLLEAKCSWTIGPQLFVRLLQLLKISPPCQDNSTSPGLGNCLAFIIATLISSSDERSHQSFSRIGRWPATKAIGVAVLITRSVDAFIVKLFYERQPSGELRHGLTHPMEP